MKKLFQIAAALMVLSSCGKVNAPEVGSYESLHINSKPKSMKFRTYDVKVKFGEVIKDGYNDDSYKNADIEFNEEGMISRVRVFREGVTLTDESEYTYNKDNQVEAIRTYDSMHELEGLTTRKYEKGLLKEFLVYKEDGDELIKQILTYTKGPRIESVSVYFDGELSHVQKYTWSKDGRSVTIHGYDSDGDETWVISEEYDKKMRLISRKQGDNEIRRIEYNDKGLITYIKGGYIYDFSESLVWDNLDQSNEYRYEYEYDEKGSWCKRIRYVLPEDEEDEEDEPDEPDELVERKIIY